MNRWRDWIAIWVIPFYTMVILTGHCPRTAYVTIRRFLVFNCIFTRAFYSGITVTLFFSINQWTWLRFYGITRYIVIPRRCHNFGTVAVYLDGIISYNINFPLIYGQQSDTFYSINDKNIRFQLSVYHAMKEKLTFGLFW